jgi:4'-phosphopantetheinyl transferase
VTAAAAVASRPATVEVLRFGLDVGAERLAQLRALLSADERQRAERLRFARDADRFVAGRGLLRSALAERAGQRPQDLRFAYGPAGKPSLADHPRLRFNAAGAVGAALVAITEGIDVGVDLEYLEVGADDLAVARQFFCPVEIAELERLGGAERQAAFLRAWTRKEAYVKALGAGLQVDLDRLAVSLLPGEPAALRWTRQPGEAERWTLVDLSDPGRGIVAALCHEAADVVVEDRGCATCRLGWPSSAPRSARCSSSSSCAAASPPRRRTPSRGAATVARARSRSLSSACGSSSSSHPASRPTTRCWACACTGRWTSRAWSAACAR